jgi:hypothetical protein
MNMKTILYKVKPPCPRCPYKLGLVHTVVNPCPQCKENGYKAYEQFKKESSGKYTKGATKCGPKRERR